MWLKRTILPWSRVIQGSTWVNQKSICLEYSMVTKSGPHFLLHLYKKIALHYLILNKYQLDPGVSYGIHNVSASMGGVSSQAMVPNLHKLGLF